MAEPVVLAVTNQKGGVGKTTTAVSVAAALAQDGVEVLLVDLDPQGNASTGLGTRVPPGSPSTYTVLVDGADLDGAVEATSVERLRLLPSSLDLAGAEIELVSVFSRERRLREAVHAADLDVDLVLIDCPPSLGLLTVNGMVAADHVVVPIQCEYYALEGLGQLLRTVEMVGARLNPELALGGVVLTMFDGRTNLSQQVVDEVRSHFGDQVFRTIVPRSVRLSEAPSFGRPITVYDPASRGARAYTRLAHEIASRFDLAVAPDERSPLARLLDEPPTGDAAVRGRNDTTGSAEDVGRDDDGASLQTDDTSRTAGRDQRGPRPGSIG